MRDTEALQRADAAFFRALLERDMPALEAMLAEEFLIVDAATLSSSPQRLTSGPR